MTKKKDYTGCLPVKMQTQDEIFDKLYEEAAEVGLDLAYAPEVLVDHIADLSKEEWVAQRQIGFGGSDASVIMGVNKFTSLNALISKKLGILKEEPADAGKQFVFDYGHVMEDALIKYFAAVTGFKVYKDDAMYYHPNYPFMIADCDAFCEDQAGNKYLIECKTSSSENYKNWKSGIYSQDAVLPVQSYVWQVRHYLAVLNINRAYLIVGFDNQANKICIIQINRDISEEVRLINQEYNIYSKYLSQNIIPEFKYTSKEDYEKVRNTVESETVPDTLELDDNSSKILNDYLALQAKIRQKDAEIKALKESLDSMKISIIESLEGHENGVLEVEKDHEIRVIYKESTRRGVDTDKLSVVYPEVYKDVFKPVSSKILKVSEFWHSDSNNKGHSLH